MTKTNRADRLDKATRGVLKNWERMVSLSLGGARGERFESFVYDSWSGWRPTLKASLCRDAYWYGREDGEFPFSPAEIDEVVACVQLSTSSDEFDARPQDMISALFNLDTLKVEQGVPWINEVVSVTPAGDVSTRRPGPHLFCRRSRVEAKWIPGADCPPAWSEALKTWGLGTDEEREYASALVGLTLTEFPHVLGVVHVWNRYQDYPRLTHFVSSLAGGSVSYHHPEVLSWPGGRPSLLDRRMVLVLGERYSADTADTRRGIAVIKALATRDSVQVKRKYLGRWEGQLPVRVWWENAYQHPWYTPASTHGIEVLPLPVNHEPIDHAPGVDMKKGLQGARDEIASHCVKALSRWVKAGRPIPERIKEAVAK